jgi:GTPase SAR1 family protein
MTNEATYRNIKRWVEGIREHAAENVVIVLVGNKSDLKSEQVVTSAEGRRLAKELGVFYEETSAITGDNIEIAFKNMLEGKYANTQRYRRGGSRRHP